MFNQSPSKQSKQPYFVPHAPGTTQAVRDAGDEGTTVEGLPGSVDPEDFAPKVVNVVQASDPTPIQSLRKTTSLEPIAEPSVASPTEEPSRPIIQSLVDKVLGNKSQKEIMFSALDESAKKAAPKIFFSVERTYLAWMHTAIILSAVAAAMSKVSEVGSVADWMGLLMYPVAIGMIVHAMKQYAKRTYMVAMRSPGPYEDQWGPVVLGTLFAGTLFVQLCVVLVTN